MLFRTISAILRVSLTFEQLLQVISSAFWEMDASRSNPFPSNIQILRRRLFQNCHLPLASVKSVKETVFNFEYSKLYCFVHSAFEVVFDSFWKVLGRVPMLSAPIKYSCTSLDAKLFFLVYCPFHISLVFVVELGWWGPAIRYFQDSTASMRFG